MVLVLSLAGCSWSPKLPWRKAPEPAPATAPEAPAPAPANPQARTAEEFDTSSAAQRQAAAGQGGAGRLLGTTVAALGDVRTEGFWVKTPLVTRERPGRVVSAAGRSAQVVLIPHQGGSLISLSAMRVLDLPLTDLPELKVYAR
ncbi:hypothetical protein DDZ14_02000 [Maritimibacter sp. 55A14]|nr:hypothetical protein DDZ14_02000 [Maritimibacter sp. 55A14]